MITSKDNITVNNERVNRILEVIMAYARLDFSQKTEVQGNTDVFDAIGAGVNMLGEELEASTISLKEKEQLLKEIHHRVKNNLQIVSSLLSLQSETIKDENFLNLIAASRNRINSMALVHEMLYSARDLKKIDAGVYIERLSQNIINTLSKPDSKIKFAFNINNNYFLDIDRIIPLGLVLNEIITNSLKYAFKNNEGEISIKMSETKNKHVLEIKDNGVGFPKNFNIEKDSNLGLQLIKMLTEQMGAELKMDFTAGTSYKITFS